MTANYNDNTELNSKSARKTGALQRQQILNEAVHRKVVLYWNPLLKLHKVNFGGGLCLHTYYSRTKNEQDDLHYGTANEADTNNGSTTCEYQFVSWLFYF